MKIRLVVADDHPLVREGVRRVVEGTPDLVILSEAADGDSLLEQVHSVTPDVVVTDLRMPGPSITELIERVRAALPAVPILVLSVYPADVWALPLLKAGASGFVSKSRTPTDLVEAVRKVHRGGRYLSTTVAQLLADEVVGGEGRRRCDLSRREFQVLCLLGEGLMVKTVARRLGISPRTVSTYRSRVLEKLGLRSTADLIRYATRHRLSLGRTGPLSSRDGHVRRLGSLQGIGV